MRSAPRFLLIASLLAVGACTTPMAPIEVTRFHLGEMNERGTVMVEPAPGAPTGMEFDMYANAVAGELNRLGFAQVDGVGQSLYVAIVDVRSGTRERMGGGSPVSIGIGGSTGGWRSGVGGGVSFGLGGNRGGLVVSTQLSVQLKRRSDQTVVWEGRARGEAPARDSGALPGRLANALFRDFPGQSGRTISVP
ncbi:hypothetical protein SCH01S_50_00220 [Sphingomonas changbaiensis NBRC 104936]|uniref:DUF4136 domain-containing protein n=1 Tax=Sphingomonas changbaiensis NBRC 104936 TaxID=1219043 RepID=A0A0E9MU38_9SPHN|nr:DUF4136 domain-containing protein [Sphingomonas changbaiensis]GAO40655.1 hypothetical protein SCH01S_50_00220 [Sphingomonas changbaiensis NBRC 104936]